LGGGAAAAAFADTGVQACRWTEGHGGGDRQGVFCGGLVLVWFGVVVAKLKDATSSHVSFHVKFFGSVNIL
jgi:hypothetical protein